MLACGNFSVARKHIRHNFAMIKLGGRHVGGIVGLMTTKDAYHTDTVQQKFQDDTEGLRKAKSIC